MRNKVMLLCFVFCLQAPDPPVSYFHAEGTPSLALAGQTSLRVTYGAPQYDGGDRITAFQVRFELHIFHDITDS